MENNDSSAVDVKKPTFTFTMQYSNDQDRFYRRALMPRARRPTELLNTRHRSESPSGRQRMRHIDLHLSPSPSAMEQNDFDKIQRDLEQKSGILRFGDEIIHAKMEDFTMERCLGEGTCSVVFLARHNTRRDLAMAVKTMRRSSSSHEENKRIIKDLSVVTKSLDCTYIVNCLGIFISQTEVWICMEIMANCLDKLLKTIRKPFPEDVIGKIAVSILKALHYLKERHNVMHRDVKPSNMLVSESGVIKLCDFGISGQLKDSIASSRQLGCIGYMAPERLETGSYDVRADIWSLGISLIELAIAEFPYKGAHEEFTIMTRIIAEPPPLLPEDSNYSNAFRIFLEYCLMKDCFRRPKYHQLMLTEFYRKHCKEPITIVSWYKSLNLPAMPKSQHARLAHQHASSASSGYASAGSDSSPGSLGSQSRSPSASRLEAPGNPDSGYSRITRLSHACHHLPSHEEGVISPSPLATSPALISPGSQYHYHPPPPPHPNHHHHHHSRDKCDCHTPVQSRHFSGLGRVDVYPSPRYLHKQSNDQRVLMLRPLRSSSGPPHSANTPSPQVTPPVSPWLLAFESDL